MDNSNTVAKIQKLQNTIQALELKNKNAERHQKNIDGLTNVITTLTNSVVSMNKAVDAVKKFEIPPIKVEIPPVNVKMPNMVIPDVKVNIPEIPAPVINMPEINVPQAKVFLPKELTITASEWDKECHGDNQAMLGYMANQIEALVAKEFGGSYKEDDDPVRTEIIRDDRGKITSIICYYADGRVETQRWERDLKGLLSRVESEA